MTRLPWRFEAFPLKFFLFLFCVCVKSSVSATKVQSGGNVSLRKQWNLGALLLVPEMFLSTQLQLRSVYASEFWPTTGRNPQYHFLVPEKAYSVLGLHFCQHDHSRSLWALLSTGSARGIHLSIFLHVTMPATLVGASFKPEGHPLYSSLPDSPFLSILLNFYLHFQDIPLPFSFCKMRDVGYWLLGDKLGSQGDSVVSLTTRLGQPQMNKPPISCGRERGAFLGSAKSARRGVGVELGAREDRS